MISEGFSSEKPIFVFSRKNLTCLTSKRSWEAEFYPENPDIVRSKVFIFTPPNPPSFGKSFRYHFEHIHSDLVWSTKTRFFEFSKILIGFGDKSGWNSADCYTGLLKLERKPLGDSNDENTLLWVRLLDYAIFSLFERSYFPRHFYWMYHH